MFYVVVSESGIPPLQKTQGWATRQESKKAGPTRRLKLAGFCLRLWHR
jgi:hypothetical protein